MDWAALAIVLAAALVCLRPALADRPPGLAEAAGALATDGVDASGRSWPLLVQAGDDRWYPPVPVHVVAVLARAGVSPDTGTMLVTGIAGGLSTWLIFLLGRRLAGSRRSALLASGLFVATPGYLALAAGRDGALLVLPCLLAWLLAVVSSLERPQPRRLALGAAALALGVYTDPLGVPAAGIAFVAGTIWLVVRHRQCALTLAPLAALFLLLLPLLGWLAMHPDSWLDTMGRWAAHPAHLRDPRQGLAAFLRWEVLGRRAGDYWHALNPGWLFLSHTVFGLAMAPLVVLGLAWTPAETASEVRRVPTALLLLAPAAAVYLDVPATSAAFLLPAGALLGGAGADRLLALGTRGAVVAWLLLALVLVGAWQAW